LDYLGHKLWEFPFGSPTALVYPSYPAIDQNGTIYIATADSTLYAINPDGSQKWTASATPSQSSPVLSSDGKIYLNSDWNFDLLCYSTNGTLLSDQSLGNGPAAVGGAIASFPMLLNGTLYFGSGNGTIYAYHASGDLDPGFWPAFGRNAQHTGRDTQICIAATVTNQTEVLEFVVEPGLPYRLLGSSNMVVWFDCTNFTSTNAFVTLPKPPTFPYFRLATP